MARPAKGHPPVVALALVCAQVSTPAVKLLKTLDMAGIDAELEVGLQVTL
jgi:hypothetical protein